MRVFLSNVKCSEKKKNNNASEIFSEVHVLLKKIT